MFNSILNGTGGVTDKSKYLCEELQEGQGVSYFELENITQLPEIVQKLLDRDDLREEMLQKGTGIVTEKHTWIKRAHQLLEWMEK